MFCRFFHVASKAAFCCEAKLKQQPHPSFWQNKQKPIRFRNRSAQTWRSVKETLAVIAIILSRKFQGIEK
jgi:hypothetical protein